MRIPLTFLLLALFVNLKSTSLLISNRLNVSPNSYRNVKSLILTTVKDDYTSYFTLNVTSEQEFGPSFTPISTDFLKDATNNIWFSRLSLLTVSAFYGTNFGTVKILNQALDPSVSG